MCSITLADAAKFLFPAGWTLLAFSAAIVYLTVPDTPRVAPAIIALASSVTAILCSIEISLLWRSNYYVLSLAPSEVPQSTKTGLFYRLIASVVLSIIFGVALVYFLAIPSLTSDPVCGHSSCGADAGWSAVAFFFGLVWLVLIRQARGRVVTAGTAAEAFTSSDAAAATPARKQPDSALRDAEAI